MALETREEFLEEWKAVAVKLFDDDAAEDEAVTRAGNELYDARVLAYKAATEKGLNLTAHRYFHGTASVQLNFMLQLPLGEVLPFLVGEYMFHQGFVAGMNYGREPSSDLGLADEDEAVECIGDRDDIIRTREVMEKRRMPSPVEALLELQSLMVTIAKSQPAGDGAPIIPPEIGNEERGYF